jgi:hypothetical protein
MPKRIMKKEGEGKTHQKYYEKARGWYRIRSRIKVQGFEPVMIERRGPLVEIKAKDGSTVKVPMDAYEEPLFAFRATDGSNRCIIVSKKVEVYKGQTKICFNAYHGAPREGGFLLPMKFAFADATYLPKQKIVITSNFRWLNSDRKHGQQGLLNSVGLAPSWIKRKGFGLFLDSLRLVEISKLGAKKWFTTILQNPHSKGFANLRGFRKLTEDEAKFIQENFAEKSSIAKIRANWRVKDITPIKRPDKKGGLVLKEKE